MKIEEYLNSIELKELIYIFLSIPIVVFIIYYNFLLPDLEKNHKKFSKEYKTEKSKLIDISKEIRKVQASKADLVPIKAKLESLKEDYKYINYLFNSLDFIQLSDDKIYNILKGLLAKAKNLNLVASMSIEWNKKYLPFNQAISIKIEGYGDYISIIKYIQFIEHIKTLLYIKSLKIYTFGGEKGFKNSLTNKKDNNLNTLSFLLTKYKKQDINYLKQLGNGDNVEVSINPYTENSNYFSVSFKGEYEIMNFILKSVNDLIISKKISVSHFTHHIVKEEKDKKTELQQFEIDIRIVGEKWEK